MEKYLNKFYDIIDKIGKQNFMLIVFIILVVAITGIYQTFSLYTELSGVSIIDGIKTYQFILNASNDTNTIIIPANSSKNIDITVNNESKAKLLYGVYYTSNNEDINIGYLPRTAHLPNATIEAKADNVVTIRVDNSSEYNASITFGVKYGFESGGELSVEGEQAWLEEYKEGLDDSILANHVINQYRDGSTIKKVSIGDSGSNGKVSLNENKNIMLDNNGEYRYYGSKSNNYVLFNNELWRIISSSNVKSSTTDAKGTQRIKLVKSENLTDDNGINTFYFDNRSSNDYSKSQINNILNTGYLNQGSVDCSTTSIRTCNFSTSGLNEEAKKLIDDAVYYFGGLDTADTYANVAYTKEHETAVYDLSNATSWVGKIGLFSASDIGYSDSPNNTSYDFSLQGGGTSSWILYGANSYVHTLTPMSTSADKVIYMGNGVFETAVNTEAVIRPTVYLKADVKWISGDGTSENPYILDDGTGSSSGGGTTTAEQIELKHT